MTTPASTTPDGPRSIVLHSMVRHYDLLASVLTLGRERALRERLVEIARLAPGETVVDVGCGTGSLAAAAKRRVGPTGTVRGIDASPEMIQQARARAAKERLDVSFEVGRAESIPLPDASVDVVLSTLMMHHLPSAIREQFAAEIRRVLKPGGRVLAVDFEPPARGRRGPLSRLHRHGHVPLDKIVALLGRAGLRVAERGDVGAADLRFALAHARVPGEAESDAEPPHRSFPRVPLPRWMPVAALAALIAAHVIVLRVATTTLVIGTLSVAALVALVMAHVGAAGGVHAILRRHHRR